MSYVVCSNTTREEDPINGNKQPNSFTNNFKSPLIIEPNSEVAVESVKINRSAEYDGILKRNNKRFFIYYGQEQANFNVAGLKSGEVTKSGVEVSVDGIETSGIRGYANELTRLVNNVALAPNIFGNNNISLHNNAQNEWQGFSMIYNQRGAQLNEATNFDEDHMFGNAGTIRRSRIDAVDTISYTAKTQTWSCNTNNATNVPDDTNFGCTAFSKLTKMMPLSPIEGEAIFHLAPKVAVHDASWSVGLTRPSTTYYNGGQPPQMPRATVNNRTYYQGGINETYMDYYVHFNHDEDLVYLYEYTRVNDGDRNYWNKRSIEYWGAGKQWVNQAGGADLAMNNLDYVIFKLVGNELKVALSNDPTNPMADTLWLTDSDRAGYDADKDHNLKPTNNSTEWLLPAVALFQSGQQCTIDHWDGIKLYDTTEVKGNVATFPDVEPKLYRQDIPVIDNDRRTVYIPGSDWCSSQIEHTTRNIIHNDTRWSQLPKALTPGTDDFTYSGVTAGSEDYRIVMVVGEERYDNNVAEHLQQQYVIPRPYHHANMASELGFSPQFNILKTSIYGNEIVGPPYKVEFLSQFAGDFNVQAAFIRVNDLTLRSFNGATNSRSQILYHLPKFSNEGRQYGELYFSPGEKTYIKLHNTKRETINQLSLDVVNRSEQVVSDLTGNTIIVLHIRQSDHKMEEHSCC